MCVHSRGTHVWLKARHADGRGAGLMGLESEIVERSKEIHADGYPMSIGELLSLYRDGDLDIHPEFQRVYRWGLNQKSALIESILLNIPVPSVFVSQREDGVWDVIDGVQRLSTIMEFVGEYRDEDGQRYEGLTLQGTDYLPSLEGVRWESEESGFSKALQRDFKRSKIEVRIIRKTSDPNAKYDLFERLNSGTDLSPQEARNCLLIMLNRDMFNLVSSLVGDRSFQAVTNISARKESESFRNELVLRFYAQAAYDGPKEDLKVDFGQFLTHWMRATATVGPLPDAGIFREVFDLLLRADGEDVFRRLTEDGRRTGPFSNAAFEFIATGVQYNLREWRGDHEALQKRIHQVWNDPSFANHVGGGVSARTRFPRMVHHSREFFSRKPG